MAFVMDMKRMIDQVAYFETIMEFPAQLLRRSGNIKVHADFALAVIRRARVFGLSERHHDSPFSSSLSNYSSIAHGFLLTLSTRFSSCHDFSCQGCPFFYLTAGSCLLFIVLYRKVNLHPSSNQSTFHLFDTKQPLTRIIITATSLSIPISFSSAFSSAATSI